MFHNRHAEHQLPRLNSNGIKNKYEGKTELGETAALDFWGLRDVHTFQTHEAMKSATSCKCSPVPRELHSTHLNVEHSKDVRPNSTMTARYTSARVCTSRSPHPVSQLLNTFKSTSRVLFVATTARNATKSLSVFSLSLSRFFFLVERSGAIQSCVCYGSDAVIISAQRGDLREISIHGHGAGGCCCCTLQITAHLAWLIHSSRRVTSILWSQPFQAEEDLLLFCVLGIKSSVQQPQHSQLHAYTGTDATVRSARSPSKCVKADHSVGFDSRASAIT